MNMRLFVQKDVSLNSRFYVQDKSIFENDVSMVGRLFVNEDVSFNKSLYVKESLTVDGDINLKQFNNEYIVNTHTTNYDLIVAEDLSVNGNLFISSDASLNGNLFVTNDASMNGNLSVGGTIDGTLATASQPNITTVGTLTGLSTSAHIMPDQHGALNLGSNDYKFNEIHGVTIQGTLITGAQPNITSIGIVSALSSTGDVSFNSDVSVGGFIKQF